MKLLAIDPGTYQAGFYSSVRRATLSMNHIKEGRPRRLSTLATFLAELIVEDGGYDFIAYEEQFVRGGAATKALFGAVGVIEAIADTSGCGVLSVPQSTVRTWLVEKWSQPKSKDPKVYTDAAARYLVGAKEHALMTEHEKDACCIYHYVMEKGNY